MENANEDSEDEDMVFNEDLFCEHGNITTDTKLYRIIPESAWNILVKYFPDTISQPTSEFTGPCSLCQNDKLNAEQESSLKKIIVTEQKASLIDLFHNRKRPTYEDLFDAKPDSSNKPAFYVVPSQFIVNWRQFIQNSSKYDSVSSVSNSSLLCPHSKLQYDPISTFQAMDVAENDFSMSLLWPAEWEYISKNFLVDLPICITKKASKIAAAVSEADLDSMRADIPASFSQSENSDACIEIKNGVPAGNGTQIEPHTSQVTANIKSTPLSQVNLELCPEICEECMVGRRLQEEYNLRNYKDKEIYVKKVIPDDKSALLKASTFYPKEANGARKSRRVNSRGEKAVTVSSNWTLKQLKIKIMQLYSIPPFDQNIWLNGLVLSDDTATLGKLSVLPGCTVIVVADEPDEKSLEMLPVLPEKAKTIEEGFKGTSLLGA